MSLKYARPIFKRSVQENEKNACKCISRSLAGIADNRQQPRPAIRAKRPSNVTVDSPRYRSFEMDTLHNIEFFDEHGRILRS